MLLPTICVVSVIVIAILGIMIADRQSNTNAAPSTRKPKRRIVRRRSPLEILKADRRSANDRRRVACDSIMVSTRASIAPKERLDEGEFTGHVVLALDVWRGKDFTLRNRAVGLSWLPFVDAPEHEETAETTTARLARVYKLNGEEKVLLDEIKSDPAGRIAIAAGTVAARIHQYPAWRLPFFDKHTVRVDLEAEVTEVTKTAQRLRAQRNVLGPPPAGALCDDQQVVNLYIDKAHVLDARIDSLLDRLQSLNNYRIVVGHTQDRHDKAAWMRKVGEIDDFALAVDSDVDRRQGERIRRAASESDFLASVYLETLAPLTVSLAMTDRG
ncbi:hypothetical protein ABLE94_20020 [Gordonia sp. VNK1]|uniref:hypothetical protein n=1 Tax=Gordonia oleivorans TaxID=3156618 RepID=UPI0032B3C1BA